MCGNVSVNMTHFGPNTIFKREERTYIMRKPVPAYVEEMIEGAVSRLNNLKNDNTVCFAFMTDTHNCMDLTERGLYAIKGINREIPIAFTCLGGDYLCNNSRTTHDMAIDQFRQLRGAIDEFTEDCPPIMVVNGNHDANVFGPMENAVLPDEMYDIVMAHHRDTFVCDPECPRGMYGYYDIKEAKIRAIFLNVLDLAHRIKDGKMQPSKYFGVIDGRQLDWVAGTALNVPENGWGVVLFAHFMPLPVPFRVNSARVFGGDALCEILSAFKRGGKCHVMAENEDLSYDVRCDFTRQGENDVIGFFAGHYHSDWHWTMSGIPAVVALAAASDNFETSLCMDGEHHYKTRGSGEESAFSVFTVDRAARRVYCIRCGAGPDYNYAY